MRFRVGGQEVCRRHGVDHLLHREADLVAVARPRLHCLGQGQHEFGIEQVRGGGKSRQRVGLPFRTREPPVVQLGRFGRHEVGPQPACLLQVIVADLVKLGRRDAGTVVLEQRSKRIGRAGGDRHLGHFHPRLPCVEVCKLGHPACRKRLGIWHVHFSIHCLKSVY
jgi:hypothetical protein